MITEETRAAFTARTTPAPAGHMDWSGARQSRNGTPLLRIGRHTTTAARVAFELRTGRRPEGTVKPECGMPHCVAPDHVEDAPARRRIRLQARYLAGGAEVPAACRDGHDQSIHGRIQPDGTPYCAVCLAARRRTGGFA